MAVTPRFSVRIPAEVRSAAEARAEREHRTLSDVIVRLLRTYGGEDQAAGEVGRAPLERMLADGVVTRASVLPPKASGEPPECRHPGVRPKNRCPACGGYNIG